MLQQVTHTWLIANISLMKSRSFGHQCAHAGRKIVQHNDVAPAFKRRINHVAADITRPACNQNSHTISISEKLEDINVMVIRGTCYGSKKAKSDHPRSINHIAAYA